MLGDKYDLVLIPRSQVLEYFLEPRSNSCLGAPGSG